MRVLIKRDLGGNSSGSKLDGRYPAGLAVQEPKSSSTGFSACLVSGTNRNFDRFFWGGPLFSAVGPSKNPFYQLTSSWLKAILTGRGRFSAPLDVIYQCSRLRPRPLPLLLARRTTARSGSLWTTRVVPDCLLPHRAAQAPEAGSDKGANGGRGGRGGGRAAGRGGPHHRQAVV